MHIPEHIKFGKLSLQLLFHVLFISFYMKHQDSNAVSCIVCVWQSLLLHLIMGGGEEELLVYALL